jgi:hypothetical protein
MNRPKMRVRAVAHPVGSKLSAGRVPQGDRPHARPALDAPELWVVLERRRTVGRKRRALSPVRVPQTRVEVGVVDVRTGRVRTHVAHKSGRVRVIDTEQRRCQVQAPLRSRPDPCAEQPWRTLRLGERGRRTCGQQQERRTDEDLFVHVMSQLSVPTRYGTITVSPGCSSMFWSMFFRARTSL